MAKSVFYSFAALLTFIGASFLSIPNSSAAISMSKEPGAIIIGVPPGCDCTAPADTCYCVTKDQPTLPTPDPGD